jgi:hypothetical protein
MSKYKKLKGYIWWIIPIALVVWLFTSVLQSQGPEGVKKISNLGNEHIESIGTKHREYNTKPPTSGPHIGSIAPWGISKEAVPDEMQVHNLEDGGVMIQYHPEKVSEEEINKLESIVRSSSRTHLIVAPYSNMESKIALTAWNRLLPLEIVEEEKIKEFIVAYEGIDHHVRSGG